MKVTFLMPARGGIPFYDLLTELMRAAAPQLDVELEVVEGDFRPDVMVARGRELAGRASRPDHVLLVNYLGVATELLPAFTAAGVPTFLIVEGLSDSDRSAIGKAARAAYRGEIVPDDVEAGRLLAELLVAEARRRRLLAPDGKVHVGVLGGVQAQASNQRFRGWQAFRAAAADVVQAGFHYGSWDEEAGRVAATALLRSAPEIRVLWCFNDAMALGAVAAAAAMGRAPGEDLLVGGIDLLDRALAGIADGTIHVSLGGHVLDGVRALLALDDRRGGREAPATSQRTQLRPVLAAEARRYLEFLERRAWRDVDFTRFSARRSRGRPPEELSLHALVGG